MKENVQIANKHMKDAQSHDSLRKNKLKLQWDTTILPPAWLKLKRLTISSLGKDMEKLKFSYTASRKMLSQSLWKTIWQHLLT